MPSGYSKTTGLPVRLGKKLSQEVKDKIRQTTLHIMKDPVVRNKISKSVSNYYSSLSPEDSIEVQKIHQETAIKHNFGYWMNGRKLNTIIKKKMSDARSGKNHPLWVKDRNGVIGRHNRSFHDPEYKQWVKAVYKRDNFKCLIGNDDCNGRLEAHHILRWKSHPELHYQINNGITLCHFHHPKTRGGESKLSPYFQELVASLD